MVGEQLTSARWGKDVVTGALLVALGAVTLVLAARLPVATSVAADPSLLPRVVALALVASGAGIGVLGVLVRAGRREAPVPDDGEGLPVALPVDVPDEIRSEWSSVDAAPAVRTTAATVAVLVAYGLLAFRVGYVVTTVAFLVGGPLVLGWSARGRPLAVLLVVAVALTAGLYVAFFVLLGVPMPRTPLP